MPISLLALREKIEGGDIVTQEDYDNTIALATPFLESANRAAESFPESPVKDLLLELPQFGCEALIKEVQQDLPSDAPSKLLGVVL